jgi:glycosyltransferase involved in cell wall biosynthesis
MLLKIVGDGPMADQVRQAVQKCAKIEWLGRRPNRETLQLIGEASVLVFPSLAYETFGRSVIESFAKGTPVITSDKGASAELVDSAVNGCHFATGDASSLAARVEQAAVGSRGMRHAARAEYLRSYTADRNYQILLSIYQRARCREDVDSQMGEPVGAITS